MNGDCRHSTGKGTIEDREEVIAALLRAVQAASHFDCDRDVWRNNVTGCAYVECYVRLAEVITAATPSEYLFDWTSEIDVDPIAETRFY